jgi:hypothetical protein
MRGFWIVCFAVAILGGVSAIILVGYPGDGRKGVDTVFGRMERGSPQIARGWR